MVLVLGGALTVYRQTHHNFTQPDTFELERSSNRRPEDDLEAQLQHWEYPDAVYPSAAPIYDPEYADGQDLYELDDRHNHDAAYEDIEYHEDIPYHDDVDQAEERYVEPDPGQPRSFPKLADRVDEFVIGLMGKLTLPVVRIGLAVIFFWFGVLKFFDGMSPAQGLVEDTVLELGSLMGFESMPSRQILFLLAIWEVAIGVGLLINRYRRTFLLMLFLQLPGTIMPVFLLPSVVWHTFPHGLTLEGQYIVKNLVLVGAALALGSQIRYDEQRARQTNIDWAMGDGDDELAIEDHHDGYWAEDTLHVASPEPEIYDDYLPYDHRIEPNYRATQYDDRYDVGATNGRTYQTYIEPRHDDWYPHVASEPSGNGDAPVQNDQPDLSQEQEAFDSFWVTDSNQLR